MAVIGHKGSRAKGGSDDSPGNYGKYGGPSIFKHPIECHNRVRPNYIYTQAVPQRCHLITPFIREPWNCMEGTMMWASKLWMALATLWINRGLPTSSTVEETDAVHPHLSLRLLMISRRRGGGGC